MTDAHVPKETDSLPQNIKNSENTKVFDSNIFVDSEVIGYDDDVSSIVNSKLSKTWTELDSSDCDTELNLNSSSPCCFPTEPPIFPPTATNYWGTTYRANDPCEDRFASLTNILLRPKSNNPVSDSGDFSKNKLSPVIHSIDQQKSQQHTLFRVSMFCVMDGHGGPFVADFASKRLLPLLSGNIKRKLDCTYVSMGEFCINHDVIALKNDEDQESFVTVDPWYSSPRDEFCCPYHASICKASATNNAAEDVLVQAESSKTQILSYMLPVDGKEQLEESRKSNVTPTILCEDPPPEVSYPQTSFSNPNNSNNDFSFHDKNASQAQSSMDIKHDIIQTIRETFLQLDEQWMNTINIQRLRPACFMTNDKCNAGSCCLVSILIQKSLYHIDGGKFVLCSSETPCLFTSHIGDCRAVLLSQPSGDDDDIDDDKLQENGNDVGLGLPDPYSDEDDSEDTEEGDDSDYSSCSSNDSFDSLQNDRIHATRNRMIPFKKRHLPMNQAVVVARSNVLSVSLKSLELTRDHTPYNSSEALLVRQRCKNAPNAIGTAVTGGIKRVAGSLSVTRALGDAYLKCEQVSFHPFKDYVPYITACPEISMKEIDERAIFIVLGTDGVWEKVDGTKVAKWVSKYFDYQLVDSPETSADGDCNSITKSVCSSTRKRKLDPFSPLSTNSRTNFLTKSNISDVIVWKILNKVRRTRKMKSLKSLMAFPPGRARRLRHDDITACVINLSGFIDL